MAVKSGPPPDNGFRRLSTRDLPAAQRFDFWRSIHTFIDLDASEREKRKDFRADLLLHIGDDGTTFGCASSDDVVTRFARSNDEYVMFSLGLSGTAKIRTDRDAARIVAPSSGLMVVDGTRPMTTLTEGQSHVYLTVPKAKIADALADKPGLLRDGFCALPQEGLAGLLMANLVWFARHGERLDGQSTAVAMKAAVDLAVGTLARAHADHDTTPDERHDDAFYAAACRYIQIHLGAPDLTAAGIAHALGCSRAHLYRVFARHEQGIGEVVRAGRLERAAVLLAPPAALPIEQGATACGFTSASAFTRSFRDWSGLTPTAFREQMRDTTKARHQKSSRSTAARRTA
jgi:AraC-like DNA-binding protein